MGSEQYQPDYRLGSVYTDATEFTESGLDAICSSYLQLIEIEKRYGKETLIGEGGMKDVYRVFDYQTKRWVALARLRADRGPEFYDYFIHEAWLTSSLQHPNIINVHDIGIDENKRPFFTMDLKGRGTLADILAAEEGHDLRDLLSIFLRICDAVSFAHSHNIVHLDLKPENIQTADFGEVLVSDWGLGKFIDQEDLFADGCEMIPEVRDNVTLFQEIKGTLGYMSPEQMRSGSEKDERTDIFSLGCILHTILVGAAPYQMSREEMKNRGLAQELELFEKRDASQRVPESLKAVVRKSLKIDPDKRYQRVTEIKNEVLRFQRGFTTEAENPNLFREAAAFCSRNRRPVLLGSVILVGVSIFGTLGVQEINRAHQEAQVERIRRVDLQEEVTATTARYDERYSQVSKEKDQVVRAYSEAGATLAAVAFFDQPRKTVDEAYKIAEESLAFDPQCRRALVEQFYLNLITLNFRGVHEQPPPKDTFRYYYMSLADAFPQFAYGLSERPSIENFCEFIETAREISPDWPTFIERIVCYDYKSRVNKGSFHRVVDSYLGYLNTEASSVKLEKKPGYPHFVLRGQGPVHLTSGKGGSLDSALKYVKVRELDVRVKSEFNLLELNHAGMTILDLRGCEQLLLEKPLRLPNITAIRIKEGQIERETLKKWIVTAGAFEVLIEPVINPDPIS